jgi:hypothetical protein
VYPASCSHTASVERSSNLGYPYLPKFATTPEWCGYWPVRMLARDGQHSDVVT